MNQFTPIMKTQFAAKQAAERTAIRAEIRRAVDMLHELGANLASSNPEYHWLRAMDALSHVFPDVDFSVAMEAERHELRLDEEGYPADDDRETIPDAERVWTPFPKIIAGNGQ